MNAKQHWKRVSPLIMFALVVLFVLSFYIGGQATFRAHYAYSTPLQGVNSTTRMRNKLKAENVNPNISPKRKHGNTTTDKKLPIKMIHSRTREKYKQSMSSTEKKIDAFCGRNWQERYKNLHHNALRSSKSERFLVYSCPSDYSGCCGYGNRLRAVVSLFYLSILTNRTFLIDWRTPEPISNYLPPHQIQWNHTVRGLEMRGHYWGSAGAEMRRATGWKIRGSNGSNFADWFKRTNFLDYFNKPVEVVTTIWYFAEEGIKNNRFLMKQARSLKITPLNVDIPDFGLIGCAFSFLFTKSVALEKYLLQWRKTISKNRPTIGIHIRTGDHQFDDRKPLNNRIKNFTEMFQCGLKVEKDIFNKNRQFYNRSQWFLATDNDLVKKYAIRHFPHRTIITTNFTPFHLDVRNYSQLWCNETVHKDGVTKCNFTTECNSDECISKYYVNRTFDSNVSIPFNLSSKFAHGILGMLVDNFLLSECDYLVLCDSSFSATAVGLSMRTVDTYTLGDHGCVIRKTGRKRKLRFFGYFKKKKK